MKTLTNYNKMNNFVYNIKIGLILLAFMLFGLGMLTLIGVIFVRAVEREETENRENIEVNYLKSLYNMDEMTEKQEEATRIIEAIGTITLNECYVPVVKSVCPQCGSKYYDKENNVRRCQDCNTVY